MMTAQASGLAGKTPLAAASSRSIGQNDFIVVIGATGQQGGAPARHLVLD